MYVYVDYLIIIEIILVNDMHSSCIPTISKSDVEGRTEPIWYYGLKVGTKPWVILT